MPSTDVRSGAPAPSSTSAPVSPPSSIWSRSAPAPLEVSTSVQESGPSSTVMELALAAPGTIGAVMASESHQAAPSRRSTRKRVPPGASALPMRRRRWPPTARSTGASSRAAARDPAVSAPALKNRLPPSVDTAGWGSSRTACGSEPVVVERLQPLQVKLAVRTVSLSWSTGTLWASIGVSEETSKDSTVRTIRSVPASSRMKKSWKSPTRGAGSVCPPGCVTRVTSTPAASQASTRRRLCPTLMVQSPSPWTTRNGGSAGSRKVMGFASSTSWCSGRPGSPARTPIPSPGPSKPTSLDSGEDGSSCTRYWLHPKFTASASSSKKSVGPKPSPTAWTLVSPRGSLGSPMAPASAARCPPADVPHVPIRAGSRPNTAAFARSHRIASCTSSIWAGKVTSPNVAAWVVSRYWMLATATSASSSPWIRPSASALVPLIQAPPWIQITRGWGPVASGS